MLGTLLELELQTNRGICMLARYFTCIVFRSLDVIPQILLNPFQTEDVEIEMIPQFGSNPGTLSASRFTILLEY